MKRNIFSLIIAFVFLMLPLLSIAEIIDLGALGPDLSWHLDEQGVLTIDGSGPMRDYMLLSNPPWYQLREDIISVEISYNVTTIGAGVFKDCVNLSSITIPESIIAIGWGAFQGCSSLQAINLPDSVQTIGNYCFNDCSRLTRVKLPNGITRISDSVFSGCTRLETVTLPDSITAIGEGAFRECDRLTDIVLPSGVTSIGKYAFFYCENLEDITIPEGVKTIDDNTFSGCSKLTNIYLPDSLTKIGEYAFNNCTSLECIALPDHIKIIGSYAFGDCDSIISITLPEELSEISPYSFFACDNLEYIGIGSSVYEIGEGAFYLCYSLASVVVPESVTYIGDKAFHWCDNLESISIPNSVTYIGDDAFEGCDQMTIYGQYGSVAQQYASEHSIPFVSVCQHILFPHSLIEPTCSENGSESYWECRNCGKFFMDAKAEKDIEEPIVIPALGHELVHHEAKMPSCTENGWNEYETCTRCDYTTYAEKAALGHNWNTTVYEWAEDNKTITATRTCLNDASHVETETVPVTYDILSPGESIPGSVIYTSADFSVDGFSAQTLNIEIPALMEMTVVRLPADLKHIEDEAFENLSCEAVIIPNCCISVGNYAFRNCKDLKYIRVPADIAIPANAFENCNNVVIDRNLE